MYDLAIIGGGPAGYSAAFEASARGLKTVIFEKKDIGGTCLNCGCIPTKYLLYVAKIYSDIVRNDVNGIHVSSINLDYKETLYRMKQIILSQKNEIIDRIIRQNISFVEGEAVVLGNDKVKCGNSIYETKFILIATGSRPASPFISHAITSDALLMLNDLPSKVSILGGGVIAVEFASIFNMLGTKVDIYIRRDRILKKWDKDIAIGVTQNLKKRGIRIFNNCDMNNLEISGLTLSATGRVPLLPSFSGEMIKVGTDGGIVVDEYGRTSLDGIYAAGDVVNESPQLAHIAMEQGRNAVQHMIGNYKKEILFPIKCIYLDQEVASVGYDEKSANDRNYDIIVGKTGMYSNARSIISKADRGFVKILATKKDRVIIGAHLMCEHAGEIISELAMAVNRGLSVDEMLETVRPHPSYCEAVSDALMNIVGKLNG